MVRGCLELSNYLSLVGIAQTLERCRIDILGNETNCAISHTKMRTTSMITAWSLEMISIDPIAPGISIEDITHTTGCPAIVTTGCILQS